MNKRGDVGSQCLKILKSGATVPSTCPELQPLLCTADWACGQPCKCWGHHRSSLLRKWGLWPSPQLLFPSPAELPEGCHQLFLAGQQSSGVFQVQPAGSQPFKVYCDMTAGKAVQCPTAAGRVPLYMVTPSDCVFPSHRGWLDSDPEAHGGLCRL